MSAHGFTKAHAHHFPLTLSKETLFNEKSALYITHTMRFMAMSLIGVFLPIYIYQLSLSNLIFSSDSFVNGALWVISYYIARSFSATILMLTVTNYIFTFLNLRRSILLSFLFLIGQITLWINAENNIYLMLVAGFIAGFQVLLYWIPYHITFIRKAGEEKDNKFGKKIGLRLLLVKIFGAISPLVGGLLLTLYGFELLFVVTMIIMLFAGLPIFMMVSEGKHQKHDIFKVLKTFSKVKATKYIAADAIGESLELVFYNTIWPLIVFLALNSFTQIGVLNSIALTLSAFAVLGVGKFIDKHGTVKTHIIGSIILSSMYLLRILSITPIVVYISDMGDKIGGSFYGVSIMSKFYEISKKSRLNEADYVLLKEFLLHISIVTTSLVMGGLLLIGIPVTYLMALAIVGVLLTLQIEKA